MKAGNEQKLAQMRLSARDVRLVNDRTHAFFKRAVELRAFTAMLAKRGIDLGGSRIMDAGCGGGYGSFLLAEQFHPSKLTSFDIMPEQIDLAKATYPSLDFRTGDLLHIDEEDNSHDAAFVFAVIHHIPDWHVALNELARCLVPGGYLMIEEPRERFTFSELETGIQEAGFTLLDHRRILFGLFRSYLAKKEKE